MYRDRTPSSKIPEDQREVHVWTGQAGGDRAGASSEAAAQSRWTSEAMLCTLYFIRVPWGAVEGTGAGEGHRIWKFLNNEWSFKTGREPGRVGVGGGSDLRTGGWWGHPLDGDEKELATPHTHTHRGSLGPSLQATRGTKPRPLWVVGTSPAPPHHRPVQHGPPAASPAFSSLRKACHTDPPRTTGVTDGQTGWGRGSWDGTGPPDLILYSPSSQEGAAQW